jgi:hypothetical protein
MLIEGVPRGIIEYFASRDVAPFFRPDFPSAFSAESSLVPAPSLLPSF